MKIQIGVGTNGIFFCHKTIGCRMWVNKRFPSTYEFPTKEIDHLCLIYAWKLYFFTYSHHGICKSRNPGFDIIFWQGYSNSQLDSINVPQSVSSYKEPTGNVTCLLEVSGLLSLLVNMNAVAHLVIPNMNTMFWLCMSKYIKLKQWFL